MLISNQNLLTLDDAPEPSNKYTEEQETQVQDHILRFRYVDTLVDHKAQRQAHLRGFDYISLANTNASAMSMSRAMARFT